MSNVFERRCFDCGFGEIEGSPRKHDPACPSDRSASDEERHLRRMAYDSGWADGRNRKSPTEKVLTHRASYSLGFSMGDAAADEAENGSSW